MKYLIPTILIAGAVYAFSVFGAVEIPAITEFDFNGKVIKTEFTDDNIDEDLIIRTDKKTYGGWNATDIYFSIENISNRTEIVDIQFYFAGEEILADISELAKDVPYEISVNNYGLAEYPCEKDWIATTTSEMGEEITQYICLEETRHCDSVSGTICTVNNALIGNHPETKYKDHFYKLPLQASKVFTQIVPVNFKTNKRTTYNIPAGEIKFFKATIEFEPKSEGEFFIYAESLNNKGKLDPWYSSNYDYKRLITLEADQISTTTSAFPVLATSTEDYLKTTTHSGKIESDDGYDIIFVKNDDTTLMDFEIEKYASSTGELVAWINTGISSTTDTTFYMYYGNSGASDVSTTTGVWDDNFVMVQHMQETPAGTTYDSTQYDNDGTTSGMDSADQVAGQIDGSLDFDGGNDYVDAVDDDSLSFTDGNDLPFSISVWAYVKDNSTSNPMVNKYLDNSPFLGEYQFSILSNNTVYAQLLDNGPSYRIYIASNETISLNTWANLVFTYDGSELYGGMELYIDGQISANPTKSLENTYVGMSNRASPLSIGSGLRDSEYNTFFNGIIDEVRISNVARTAGWIATEYNNQVSVGDFMTFGAEETEAVAGAKAIFKTGIKIKAGKLIIK